jgi:hypothetical protein
VGIASSFKQGEIADITILEVSGQEMDSNSRDENNTEKLCCSKGRKENSQRSLVPLVAYSGRSFIV